jgi:hypothetical protein
MIFTFSLLAALLQLIGYITYIRLSIKHEVVPNGATWLMFAYGVSLLTVLEWDNGAHPFLLFLPITCAILAVVTAVICGMQGTIKWPEDRADQVSFLLDVILTLVYCFTAILASRETIDNNIKTIALNWFLIISNATAFTSFTPLLRGVWKNPRVENPLPWIIWTLAYFLLGCATVAESDNSVILIYPISNFLLHGLVAVLALRKTR